MNIITDNSPALYQISTLEEGFNLLNEKFFNNKLPHVMINQQRKRSDGYFSPYRWKTKEGSGDIIDEINLTPSAMNRDNKEVLATLLHEMVHQWQHRFGKRPRAGYHNQQWADKMVSVGLKPVSAGHPGKMTGQKVGHIIIKDGLFDTLINESVIQIKYYSLMNDDDVKKTKVKYTCTCKNNVWGKPGLKLLCNDCKNPFIEKNKNMLNSNGIV